MKEFLHKWDSSSVKVKDLLLFLLAYIIAHAVFLSFFYSGFITSYSALYTHLLKLGVSLPWLKYVPYYSWSPFLAAFLHPLFTLAVLLLSFPFVKPLKTINWKSIEQYKWIRLITFLAALLLAWELSTYQYNYYLDTPQYFDRFMLIVLALLIWRNPLFVIPFLVLSLLYRSQFNYPIGGFTLYDKRILFDILILLYCYLFLRIYVKQFTVNFIFIVICLVGSNYFFPAIEKILISPHGYEWLGKNSLVNFFVNSHQYGWLQATSSGTIEVLKSFLQRFNVVCKAITILIEFSAIVLLWKRKTTMLILAAFTVAHLGIFVFGGMIFWKWIAIDLTLIYIVSGISKTEADALFNRQNLKLSFIVIALSFIWFRPFNFAWFDTKANQYYTYQVVDEKGNIYNLERNDMNPYHQFFQYEPFLYLVNKKTLEMKSFGNSTNYKIAKEIDKAGVAGMPALIDNIGKNRYDSNKVKAYEDFIKTYFSNRNKRTETTFIPALFAAPNHLYNEEASPVYTGKEKVVKFRAIFNQSYFNDNEMVMVSKKVIEEITIP